LQNNGINGAQAQGSPLQRGGAGRFDASPQRNATVCAKDPRRLLTSQRRPGGF